MQCPKCGYKFAPTARKSGRRPRLSLAIAYILDQAKKPVDSRDIMKKLPVMSSMEGISEERLLRRVRACLCAHKAIFINCGWRKGYVLTEDGKHWFRSWLDALEASGEDRYGSMGNEPG